MTDDLPRMTRGRSRAVPRSLTEQSEGLMELDQVDSRGRRWRRFLISGQEYLVNMSVLEPYLQVLSHGGQTTESTSSPVHFKNQKISYRDVTRSF